MKHILFIIFFLFSLGYTAFAQTESDTLRPDPAILDSIYIAEIEYKEGPEKVLHAEPLYIDLIRDLGARKGEKEWNIGMGMTDKLHYDAYEALIEYEWAPIDRLGLEVEIPFTFYGLSGRRDDVERPSDRVESLKLAAQWSFFVSQQYKTSMALGYIHELEFTDLNTMASSQLFTGNVFNPFFVAAKRWGDNWHTLIYTGPEFVQHFQSRNWETHFAINTNLHYMITGTRNFIGLEINQVSDADSFHTTLRPQMRLGIAENLLIGIVAGIPIDKINERLSVFMRLIYEPGH